MGRILVPAGWRRALGLLAAAGFVIACGVAASRLTLFWDDYDFVLVQIQEPWTSLIMGSNGHGGPLSRVALRLVTYTFGLWYPGYVMVNATLAVAAAWMLVRALRDRIGVRWWWGAVAVIIYVTSLGMLSSVMIAICLEWFIALAFGAAAALAVARRRHWAVWGVLLALSWLSMTGLFPVTASLVAVVYALTHWPTAKRPDRRRIIQVGVSLIAIGLVGSLLGVAQTWLWTSEYYRPVADATGLVPVPRQWSDVALTTLRLGVTWASAPLLVVGLTSPTLLTTLAVNAVNYPFLFLAAVVAVVGVVIAVVVRTARQRGNRAAVDGLLTFALLAPAFVWAAMITVARDAVPYGVRYQVVWLLPVAGAFGAMLCLRTRSKLLSGVRVLAAVLVTGTAVVGVVRLPVTLVNAADVDRPRSTLSMLQREQMHRCASDPAAVTPVPEVSPALSAQDFCLVVDDLRDASIAGRWFGFTG